MTHEPVPVLCCTRAANPAAAHLQAICCSSTGLGIHGGVIWLQVQVVAGARKSDQFWMSGPVCCRKRTYLVWIGVVPLLTSHWHTRQMHARIRTPLREGEGREERERERHTERETEE